MRGGISWGAREKGRGDGMREQEEGGRKVRTSNELAISLQSPLSHLQEAWLHAESQKPSPKLDGLHPGLHQLLDTAQSPLSFLQLGTLHWRSQDPSPSHSGLHAGAQFGTDVGEEVVGPKVGESVGLRSVHGAAVGIAVLRSNTAGAVVSEQSPPSESHSCVLHSGLQTPSAIQARGHEHTRTGGRVVVVTQSPRS